MAVAEIRLKKWTRDEWHRLIELGVLDNLRVELLDGDIVEMSPQSPIHAGTVTKAAQALRRAFGDEFVVREHCPVAPECDERSEPEPDISVSRGSLDDFMIDHPSRPDLIVEVAVSSLPTDRKLKASLYARAGQDDYWILIPENGILEVYRNPVRDGMGTYDGWSYGSFRALCRSDRITALALPGREIPVADLLPS